MKNFTAREGRTLKKGDKVQVYRNLNNGKWSIVKGGLVHGYADEITLTNVTMYVGEAGRQKVIKEKRKNVHAGARGYIADDLDRQLERGLTYNPYKRGTFYNRETEEAVSKADTVQLINGKMYY